MFSDPLARLLIDDTAARAGGVSAADGQSYGQALAVVRHGGVAIVLFLSLSSARHAVTHALGTRRPRATARVAIQILQVIALFTLGDLAIRDYAALVPGSNPPNRQQILGAMSAIIVCILVDFFLRRQPQQGHSEGGSASAGSR